MKKCPASLMDRMLSIIGALIPKALVRRVNRGGDGFAHPGLRRYVAQSRALAEANRHLGQLRDSRQKSPEALLQEQQNERLRKILSKARERRAEREALSNLAD